MSNIVTVYLNDRDQTQIEYTVDDAAKDVAITDDGSFLLITHTDGASYFNIASVQFFEINEEELGQ